MRSDRRLGDLGSVWTQQEWGRLGDITFPTEQGLVRASGLSQVAFLCLAGPVYPPTAGLPLWTKEAFPEREMLS